MNAQALLAAIVCLSYYGNQGGRLFFGLQDFLGVGTLLNDPDTEFPQDENDSQSWCPSDATRRMIHSGGSRSWICHHLPPGAAHLPRWGKHPCLCELHPFLPPEIQRKLTNNVDNLKCFCTPLPTTTTKSVGNGQCYLSLLYSLTRPSCPQSHNHCFHL